MRGDKRSRAEVASAAVLLGTSSVESQYDSLPAGEGEAFRLRGSLTGVADVGHLYISARNLAKTVVMGIYSNLGGRPGLLLSAGSAPASAAGTWTTVSITPIELQAGRTYWLAILGEGGTLRYRDRAWGSCPSQTSAQTSLGALPAYWSTGSVYGDCPASAYLTAGSPASPPAPTEPVPPAPPIPTPPAPVEEPAPTPPPADTALPAIAGTATEGQELGASSGSWSGSPTAYGYQWQDCNSSGERCSEITGASSSSYRLTASDVGHTIRVVVTASNAGGSTSASSAASAVVSAAESSGLLVGSSAVQSSTDTSAGGSAEAFEYTSSTGGTVHSLSLYVAAGNTAPAIVVGLYGGTSGEPSTLLASGVIVSPSVGAWNAVEVTPVSVHSGSVYWLAALAPTGTLALRDLATGGGPTETSASSSLTVLPSSWSNGASWANSPASFYASTNVVGSPPPAAPVNTTPPAIGGSAVEGQTLSATTGSWSGSPTSFSYQWEDCNTAGEGCTNISKAVSSTYKLISTDVGNTLRVVVTATNTGGSTQATSAATAAIAATPPTAPVNTALPTVSGSTVEGQTLS
ncbi:MAG TPA: hypothetical protein VMB91_11950, partial [Solirubrobacteraceae bacterium]|nr:hypothetical protein [Solirubrobacteraceae bacterium]